MPCTAIIGGFAIALVLTLALVRWLEGRREKINHERTRPMAKILPTPKPTPTPTEPPSEPPPVEPKEPA